MESALTTGKIPTPLHTKNPIIPFSWPKPGDRWALRSVGGSKKLSCPLGSKLLPITQAEKNEVFFLRARLLNAQWSPGFGHKNGIISPHKTKLSAFLFPPKLATPLSHRTLIPSWTYPSPMKTLLPKWAAVPWLMWIGGIKFPMVSPLLQVDIGGVGRTPLWRSIYHQPTSSITGTRYAKIIATFAGPHVGLPI